MNSRRATRIGTTSVILTSYAGPAYLRQALLGLARQTTTDFEIVVSESTHRIETRAVVEEFANNHSFVMRHVAPSTPGASKPEALNLAIHASDGDYLVFTEDDCVPRCDFVARHLELATRGRFLSAGCRRLTAELTQRILGNFVEYHEYTDTSWLDQHVGCVEAKWRLIGKRPSTARLLDLATTTRPTFNGQNASAWKKDLVRANGFNHAMHADDVARELGERLENADIAGTQARHRIVNFRLHCQRDTASDAWVQQDRNHLRSTLRHGFTQAAAGLQEIRSMAG